MTRPSASPIAAESDGADARAWVARRRRLLDQVDDALRRTRRLSVEDDDWAAVSATLQRVRSELRRDVSTADVDASTQPHLDVVQPRRADGAPHRRQV